MNAKSDAPETELERYRVGVVASDPLRVVGFAAVFEGHARVEIVTAPMQELLRDHKLHIFLLSMPANEELYRMIETVRGFRPDMRVIVISRAPDHEQSRRMIGAGARGILHDAANEADITMAIETVAGGSIWAPRRVLASLIGDAIPRAPETQLKGKIEMTVRERDVLERLVSGATNRQIGDELAIEERTVKAHIAKLMRKVGVNNRTALTMQALKLKLIQNADAAE
jgi:DNA-binding NarL/FixJ family response regulator